MKTNDLSNFLQQAEEKGFSKDHRHRIDFNINKYHAKVKKGKQQFEDLEKARQLAKNIKHYTIEHLPRLLLSFENKFEAHGGKVIWAENSQQALEAVNKIFEEKKASSVVKSKSMITEEIGLNHFLEQKGIEVIETDLGEFIVQVKGETPYHIVTPAMHLSKEDIAKLFHQKFDTPLTATPKELTHFVRKELRNKFAESTIGITGGNFLLADTGSLALVANEGNARLATTLPDTHIAIVGIEKVLPSIEHLDLFLPLLATFGTGQKITAYNTILSGPQQSEESDGPSEMYVILVDNGRSSLVEDAKLRESLYCIRCGSCLNNCPVYKSIGGHTYKSPYSGPIGSIISQHLQLGDDYKHLSHASSLCGSCTENCPVNIDLHNLLLYNREKEATEGQRPNSEYWIWWAWRKGMLNRSLMNAPSFLKNIFGYLFLQRIWGPRRTFPQFPAQTFNQLWKKGKV